VRHGVRPPDVGRGYLLPRPISVLTDAGDIARITEAEALRIYREQLESRRRQDG
jgi:hypothetical protein